LRFEKTLSTLFSWMKQYQPSRQRTRLQALYLLKSGEAASITHASSLLGYSRKTVPRWLKQYQREGLQGLLTIRHGGGRPAGIPLWAQTKLKARLNQPRGFASYVEILIWLASECAIRVHYWVVYHWVRQRWKAKLKTACPSHAQQDLHIHIKSAPKSHLDRHLNDIHFGTLVDRR
jgi:transposase